MKEEELIHQIKKGNKDAFASLLSSYRDSVLNICYKFLLNKEDAEDVAQEVFVEVYFGIKKFRGESKLSTWIYRIAVTRSLDEIKKRNRKKRFTSIGRALGLEHITHMVAGDDAPDKKLEKKEDFELIKQALNRLPDNQRIAITLSKIEGHSNPEISEIMKTSLTAVDSLIYRAKQNLRSILVN
jgi:RNA polymerase sigma-70 factor, ECF subfamily